MKNKVVKRDKAFLGSIIGAVGGVISSAIGAAKRRKAEEKAFKMQQEEQYRQDSLAAAQAMTQSYANQDYVDEYKKKVILKNGGKMKTKQGNYTDRIKNQKKYACGGRKKANFGSTIANQFSGNNLNDTVGGIVSGIGSFANSLIGGPSTPKMIKKLMVLIMNKKLLLLLIVILLLNLLLKMLINKFLIITNTPIDSLK